MSSKEFAQVFRFEEAFRQTMNCIPMAVRYKLDACGIKLKLNEWLAISEEERSELLQQSIDSKSDAVVFRERLMNFIRQRTDGNPELMEPANNPVWDDLNKVPDDLAEKAKSEGVVISVEKWRSLSTLQRFVLVKLSRPGHHNKNFIPALKEFKLI